MMKKRVIAISITGVILTLISFYFDKNILKFIEIIRGNLTSEFFILIEFISSKEIMLTFLIGLFALIGLNKINRRRIKELFLLIFTFISVGIIGFILKFTIHKLRPYQTGIISALPEFQKVSHNIWNFSFPSFHAILVFCVLPLIWKNFPKFRYIWIVFAILVSFSRIYLGLHYMSDVIAGAFIGYLIGYLIIKLDERKKLSERVYGLIRK